MKTFVNASPRVNDGARFGPGELTICKWVVEESYAGWDNEIICSIKRKSGEYAGGVM